MANFDEPKWNQRQFKEFVSDNYPAIYAQWEQDASAFMKLHDYVGTNFHNIEHAWFAYKRAAKFTRKNL